MSVKCELSLDELTVQVWLLYDYQNFKYCTLFVSGTELRTDGRTIQFLDAPVDLSGPVHRNNKPIEDLDLAPTEGGEGGGSGVKVNQKCELPLKLLRYNYSPSFVIVSWSKLNCTLNIVRTDRQKTNEQTDNEEHFRLIDIENTSSSIFYLLV